jgi:VWFA-related protein
MGKMCQSSPTAVKTLLLGALAMGAAARLWAQAPAGPLTPAPGVVAQQGPRPIKVRSILVNTPVTVRNLQGNMVHDLEAVDFRITDNGVEQKITHFALGGDPISLVVVVETSSRIEPILPQIRKAGILLTQTVTGPTGEAAIIGFDEEINKLLDFTTGADAVEATMSTLKEGFSGAKLFDAMSLAVDMLSKRPEVSETELGHRRVMLVLSEAHDGGSEAKLGDVLRRAQLANITIYTVGLSSTRSDLTRKPDDQRPPNPAPDGTFSGPPAPGTVQTPTTENQKYEGVNILALAAWAVEHTKDQVTAHALEIASTATGGSHVSTWKNRTIEKVIDEMGGELHAQYTISYTPTENGVGGYHEIAVRVAKEKERGLKVRARPGYYLAGPESSEE